MTCENCGAKRFFLVRRVLCWSCWKDTDVRETYGFVAEPKNGVKRGHTVVGNFYGEGKPTAPTDAKPGTLEKVEVLERRAVAGEVLFHPEDAV